MRVLLAATLLLRNASLIDGTGAPLRAGVDILLADGRIEAIGSGIAAPAGAQVIDASRKYVVPGLVDCHVHLDAPMVFQLTLEERQRILEHTPRAFLYNGVTTVLNLSSDADWIWARRAAQREGRLLAPRIFATGRSFTPEGGWGGRHGGTLKTAEEVRARARDYAAHGADGLKLVIEDGLGGSGTYVVMPREMREALAEEARRASIPLYVHAINLSEYRLALPLRPRAIVHGFEDALPEGDTLLPDLAERGVFVVPTLSLFESFVRFDDHREGLDDKVLRGSVPAFLLERMNRPEFIREEKERFRQVARMDVYPWVRRALPLFKMNTRKMHEAGLRIAVGTDAGGPVGYNFQGYNTPRELELLVEAGLTPMEAIVAATRTGAELLGAQDRLGTIEPGKLADLLILEANPLEDIRSIRSIDKVILGGAVHERRAFSYRD